MAAGAGASEAQAAATAVRPSTAAAELVQLDDAANDSAPFCVTTLKILSPAGATLKQFSVDSRDGAGAGGDGRSRDLMLLLSHTGILQDYLLSDSQTDQAQAAAAQISFQSNTTPSRASVVLKMIMAYSDAKGGADAIASAIQFCSTILTALEQTHEMQSPVQQ